MRSLPRARVCDTLEEVRASARQVAQAFASFQSLVAPNSPALYQFDQAMQELAAAARSFREVADLLQRNPNALIYGKRPIGER